MSVTDRAMAARRRAVELLPWLALAAAVLAGAWWRLGWALQNGFWRDEALFIGVASMPTVGETLAFLANHESHPPLYYLMARGWGALAGWGDLASYVPSLTFGLATLAAMFLIPRRLVGLGAGVFAAVLGALSATLIVDSGMARPYAFLELMVLLATWLLYRFLRQPDLPRGAAWWVAAVIMVYTHNWTWVVVGSHLLLMLLAGTDDLARRAGRTLVLAAAVLAAFGPWLPVLLAQVRYAGHPSLPPDELWRWTRGALEALVGFPKIVLVVVILIALPAWYLADGPGRRNAEAGPSRVFLATVLLALLIVTVLLPVTNLMVSQCFATLTPTLLCGFSMALRPGRPDGGRLSALAQVLLPVLAVMYWLMIGDMPKSNVREVTGALAAAAGPDDLILLVPVYSASAFGRYYHGPGRVETIPDGGLPIAMQYDRRRQRDTDPKTLPRFRALLDSAMSQQRRVWLVSTDSPSPELMAVMRVLQKRLLERYRPPRALAVPKQRKPMYETFSAAAYAPALPASQ